MSRTDARPCTGVGEKHGSSSLLPLGTATSTSAHLEQVTTPTTLSPLLCHMRCPLASEHEWAQVYPITVSPLASLGCAGELL